MEAGQTENGGQIGSVLGVDYQGERLISNGRNGRKLLSLNFPSKLALLYSNNITVY